MGPPLLGRGAEDITKRAPQYVSQNVKNQNNFMKKRAIGCRGMEEEIGRDDCRPASAVTANQAHTQ